MHIDPKLHIRILICACGHQAAAVNALGIGPQTHDTLAIRTSAKPSDKPPTGALGLHLGGHGHEHAVEENGHGVVGPLVTLDDVAQTVRAPGRVCLGGDYFFSRSSRHEAHL